MAITDEQLDLILEDEELAKLSKEYQEYRMTYREFNAKRDTAYKRLGIEVDAQPINHLERLDRLEELLAENYIDKDMYDKKLKRVLQDIKDEGNSRELELLEMLTEVRDEVSSIKAQLYSIASKQSEQDDKFKALIDATNRIEQRLTVGEPNSNEDVIAMLHRIEDKLNGRPLRLVKGNEG
ncbi:hypothetical protein [Paraliobacillus ryukyuensis]|uniref:hypothetical protein n=1 Tax=Paraliobacillus ryukyuensis TaxID=200904 RepID=UPI0009A5D567|nr:hypothetical protein [Paraliobacillus ryukyuensis]